MTNRISQYLTDTDPEAPAAQVYTLATIREDRDGGTTRELAEAKQRPLPLAEQQRRAEVRASEHALRYPVAPTYEDMPNRSQRVRLGSLDPMVIPSIVAAMMRLMQVRNRQRAEKSQ